MARPSIVPIALTLDDRTGYTLWAPPWEEDGEEWQAFLGTTEEDPDDGPTARVHLFPSPAALATYCRTSTDHDLADHPVWPVVVGLGAADLTPDDDHRFDLDGVYDIAAENPDRWAVEELAATIDIVSRLAECLDTTPEPDDYRPHGMVGEVVIGAAPAVRRERRRRREEVDASDVVLGRTEERLPFLAVLLPGRRPQRVAGAVVEGECDRDDAWPGHGDTLPGLPGAALPG